MPWRTFFEPGLALGGRGALARPRAWRARGRGCGGARRRPCARPRRARRRAPRALRCGLRLAAVAGALELALLLRGQDLLGARRRSAGAAGGRGAGLGRRLLGRGLLGGASSAGGLLGARAPRRAPPRPRAPPPGPRPRPRRSSGASAASSGASSVSRSSLLRITSIPCRCRSRARGRPSSAGPGRGASRRSPAVFSSSPVAWRKRRLNASSRASLSAWTRSWSPSACTSAAFTGPPPRGSRTWS